MKAESTSLPGVLVLAPSVFADDRGAFFESWNARAFGEATGVDAQFLQDNHSISAMGVLRGMHYQLPPKAQGKLVRCVRGSAWDAVIDIRRSSPTFGKWFGLELSAANRRQIWVPAGFAHGFMALEEGCEMLYKTTDYWSREHERCIRWDDPAVGISWPAGVLPRLISRDATAPGLADAEVFA